MWGATYSGPATLAMPYIPPIRPIYAGRCRRGTLTEMMSTAPLKIPAEPIPATARPIIRAVEVGATPQMREPSSKMKSAET